MFIEIEEPCAKQEIGDIQKEICFKKDDMATRIVLSLNNKEYKLYKQESKTNIQCQACVNKYQELHSSDNKDDINKIFNKIEKQYVDDGFKLFKHS